MCEQLLVWGEKLRQRAHRRPTKQRSAQIAALNCIHLAATPDFFILAPLRSGDILSPDHRESSVCSPTPFDLGRTKKRFSRGSCEQNLDVFTSSSETSTLAVQDARQARFTCSSWKAVSFGSRPGQSCCPFGALSPVYPGHRPS